MRTSASSELLGIIARLRRAMPRNTDAMAICDALEQTIVKPARRRQAKTKTMRGYRQRKRMP